MDLCPPPSWGRLALASWLGLPAGRLAPEAVAVETQADVLLNSSVLCGFSVECPSLTGQDGGWEGWGWWSSPKE